MGRAEAPRDRQLPRGRCRRRRWASAPASAAPWIAFTPTPPAPMTTALLPGVSWAVLRTAPTPVMTPQARRHARSSPRSAGTGDQLRLVHHHRLREAGHADAQVERLAGPARGAGAPSSGRSCPSQRYAAPVRQGRQPPQVRRSDTTTRSPGRTRVTPGPTSLDDARRLVPRHHRRRRAGSSRSSRRGPDARRCDRSRRRRSGRAPRRPSAGRGRRPRRPAASRPPSRPRPSRGQT